MNLFGKQVISMTWDFSEAAILHETVGGFTPASNFIAECILKLPTGVFGIARQQDAAISCLTNGKIVSTDPPYYDNIGYADLSDFFYIWMRRSLKNIFPNLFATLVVPKVGRIVATLPSSW
jgi:putative DNA methylase